MATIKSYTDLEQSKKLAEILPLESADMKILSFGIDIKRRVVPIDDIAVLNKEDEIPCWSLAALLKLIPNFNMYKRTIECRIETTNHLIDKAWDLVDAAFEMVCWLKENNEL